MNLKDEHLQILDEGTANKTIVSRKAQPVQISSFLQKVPAKAKINKHNRIQSFQSCELVSDDDEELSLVNNDSSACRQPQDSITKFGKKMINSMKDNIKLKQPKHKINNDLKQMLNTIKGLRLNVAKI